MLTINIRPGLQYAVSEPSVSIANVGNLALKPGQITLCGSTVTNTGSLTTLTSRFFCAQRVRSDRS
ncbi:MAG: hypothetical protein KME31_14650 [Tolypothrix carrinoi HA7290-LM1]|uniref:hypothetical protein n=1 Tax=Hassallia byssoidea TaxID=482630 RepID=UPI0019114CEC|nr:hypothetical protein [Hassalia byssoidea]MBW4569205.1 hypothetical protein [Tolypothrix carrinoi HA7290-LM1]